MMKKVLLVAATAVEIQPTLDLLRYKTENSGDPCVFNELQIYVCITGVGMVNTAFELGRLSTNKFDAAINAGVAGAFHKYQIGAVVEVSSDCLSEFGAENDQAFLKIDDLNLGKQIRKPSLRFASSILEKIPQAKAITVNTVHGNEASIKKVRNFFDPDIESMEGAAFFHAAAANQWPAVQLRAISNMVEKRNRDHWNLPLAIQNLNSCLFDLLKKLEKDLRGGN